MDKFDALWAYKEANNDFIEEHSDWLNEQDTIDQFNQMQKEFFANLPGEIKKDPIFYLQLFELLKINSGKLYFAEDGQDKDLLDKLMELALDSADQAVLGDKKLMLTVVKTLPEFLKRASKELQDDREVVMAAVKKDGFALKFASPNKRADREVVTYALQSSKNVEINGSPLEYAEPCLKGDKQFVLGALQENPWSYRYVPQYLINEDQEVEHACSVAEQHAPHYGTRLDIILGYELNKIEVPDIHQAIEEATTVLSA